jgi:PKD repeat protein/agmatine/peptidylarginine deiminase
MTFKGVSLKRKPTKMRKNSSKVGIMFFLLLFLLVFNAYGNGKKLTHEMTAEEKALMPAYLESLKSRAQTPPPPALVRNIAEFEPMEGVLIAYPLGIPVSLVADMSQDVMVTTIVDGPTRENQARNLYVSNGVNMDNCNFLHAPHDSYWTRDYGPWYVTDGNRTVSIINFTYNRPRPDDNNIPVEMASFLGVDLYEMDLVHAGGNYMTDGWGISVSTDLIWDENPTKTPAQINQVVYDYLGIQTYHVTEDPLGSYIKHVDCWAKHLDADKILITRVPQNDPRYSDYEALVDYFASQTSGYGNNYQVYRVDSPDGEPYTNSLILNKRVFVPIMGTSADSDAISAYTTAMPGYEVIGVSGSWETTDALHCRVKGIPDRGLLYIQHMPLSGEKPEQAEYQINADIIPYSGMPIISDTVKIYYRVDEGNYYTSDMTNTSGDTYTGSIPGQPQGSEIGYYIHVSDTSGRTGEHPLIGAQDPHEFNVSAPPQPPVADFSADNTTVYEGDNVRFTDLTANNPTSWSWTFTGGSPSTGTEQDPLVTYNTRGTYTVTLTADNSAGSDSETKVDYITVLPAGSCLGEIINPGFEPGSTAGWTETGSVSVGSDAHSGAFGVSLDASGSTIEQVVTGLCANTTYTASAWGKAKNNARVYLGVKNYGGSELTAKFTDGSNWRQKYITFTTGASNTSVTIFFIRTPSSKSAGVGDDFELAIVN